MATYQTLALADLLAGSYMDSFRCKVYSDEAHTIDIPLTGATITAHLRGTEKSVAVEIWTTADNTIVISGANDSYFTLEGRNISAQAGQYYMDISIVFADGKTRKRLRVSQKIIASF